MDTVICEEGVVSPYQELMAYEYLCATEGTSRNRVSRIISENGGLPSSAALAVQGIFPDTKMQDEIRRYVEGRLDGFSPLRPEDNAGCRIWLEFRLSRREETAMKEHFPGFLLAVSLRRYVSRP